MTYEDFRVVNRQGRQVGKDQHHHLREHTIPQPDYPSDEGFERRKVGFLYQSGF